MQPENKITPATPHSALEPTIPPAPQVGASPSPFPDLETGQQPTQVIAQAQQPISTPVTLETAPQVPHTPVTNPIATTPVAPHGPQLAQPGVAPIPSQMTAQDSSGSMKKTILIIIGTLTAISVLGAGLFFWLASSDDPDSSNSSNSSNLESSSNQTSADPVTFETIASDNDNYTMIVPKGWALRDDTAGTKSYSDEQTDTASSVSLFFSTEPVVTIPGFVALSDSEKKTFSTSFIEGFESSFTTSAEQEGGNIDSVSMRSIDVTGSELSYEFEFNGKNTKDNQIEGIGRYLTNDNGQMFSVLITALSEDWDENSKDYKNLVRSYSVK